MDHGRTGPVGALGGESGGVNRVAIHRQGEVTTPPHLSKAQDISLAPGDAVEVRTPGGGGYKNPFDRRPELVMRDVRRGYYTKAQAEALFGVILNEKLGLDELATRSARAKR